MVVPVLLNESRTSSLLLDTGASITVLSTQLAQSLGLRASAGKTISRQVAADVTAKVATLDSITVGGLSRSDFPVAVVDLDLGTSARFDGILGMDFLGNYTIRIDNQANKYSSPPDKQTHHITTPPSFYPFLTGSFLGKFTHLLPGEFWVK